jgi:hypothetical protein
LLLLCFQLAQFRTPCSHKRVFQLTLFCRSSTHPSLSPFFFGVGHPAQQPVENVHAACGPWASV